jgi:DNA-binding NarL/FixJ family response regulator
VKVFILDAHAIYRGGLAACIATFDEIASVGEAPGVSVAKRDPDLFSADVLIVDNRVDGAEAFVRWVYDTTGAHVIVCGSRCDDSEIRAATDAGAAGFLCKETLTPGALRTAIRAAAAGEGPTGREAIDTGGAFSSRLTSREREVLRLVAAGHPTREVARELCYSERTIKNVIHDVVTKLNARTRSQAVAEAVRGGLI